MAMLGSPVQFFLSIPPVTRAWSIATVACSFLYLWLQAPGENIPYLTLVPGSSLFFPWTFVTSGLVEITMVELIITLLVIPPSLRYLERVWGSIEILKFIVVTLAGSNIIAFGFNWIEFIATRDADMFLYGMQYHGQQAIQIGILVAFTQLIPEYQVQLLGVLSVRVKTLPMAYLTFSTVMTILGFQCPYIIIQFGWFVSWIYLRFYKKNISEINGVVTYGDRSETFSLISWFPPFVHRPLTLLGNFVYGLANRFHLLPGSGPGSDVESGGYAPVPVNARAEAERRRAMALKALDQRIATSSGERSSTPSDDTDPRAAALQAAEARAQKPAHANAPSLSGSRASPSTSGAGSPLQNGSATAHEQPQGKEDINSEP